MGKAGREKEKTWEILALMDQESLATVNKSGNNEMEEGKITTNYGKLTVSFAGNCWKAFCSIISWE